VVPKSWGSKTGEGMVGREAEGFQREGMVIWVGREAEGFHNSGGYGHMGLDVRQRGFITGEGMVIWGWT
jgi:hypothetical protein